MSTKIENMVCVKLPRSGLVQCPKCKYIFI